MSAGAAGGAAATITIMRNRQEQEHDYQEAVKEERNNLVRMLAKHAEFREAAAEMLDRIPDAARIPDIKGPSDLKVRHGLFSWQKKPVPDDVQAWGLEHVKPMVEEELQGIVRSIRDDFTKAYPNAVYTTWSRHEKYYKNFNAVDFYIGLNPEKRKALGGNSVAISVQHELFERWRDPELHQKVKESVSREQDNYLLKSRAIVPIFRYAMIGAIMYVGIEEYKATAALRGEKPPEPSAQPT